MTDVFGGGGGGGVVTLPYVPLADDASANVPRSSYSNNYLNPVGTAKKDVPEEMAPIQLTSSSSSGGLNFLQPASVGYFEAEKYPGHVGVNSQNQEYLIDNSGISLNPTVNDQIRGQARSGQGPGGDWYWGSAFSGGHGSPAPASTYHPAGYAQTGRRTRNYFGR